MSIAARDSPTSSRRPRDQLRALHRHKRVHGANVAGGGSPSQRTAPEACDGGATGGGGSRDERQPPPWTRLLVLKEPATQGDTPTATWLLGLLSKCCSRLCGDNGVDSTTLTFVLQWAFQIKEEEEEEKRVRKQGGEGPISSLWTAANGSPSSRSFFFQFRRS